jgi:Carboxypeptidase regulatory-like domain/TonB dependent receptor
MVKMRLFRVLVACLFAIGAAAPAFSQGNTGRILGSVTDPSGANVGGATVTVTDTQRGVSKTLVSDQDGAYVAIDLVAGTYTVHAEAKGFKVFERKNILLEVGKDVRVDIVLQTGSNTETITVTEDIPMVDTTTTTLGGTIANDIINDLPLNGRNYQNLLTLRPGVTVYPGGGPWTQTTNGVRPEDTSYIVDGLGNDEAFMGLSVTNAAAVAGDAATLLPIDAIQEFNVQENPKAEFGWKPGAITSVGLKSGTNDIHGTAYGFGRSDSFDARNYFDQAGTPKTPVELEQFGGTIGGKIIRDKLFYFGGYEGQRYTVGNSFPLDVPTTASIPTASGPTNGCVVLAAGNCNQSIPDATADLALQGKSVSPLSQYLLQFFGPNGSQSKTINRGFPNVNASDNGVGKIDYHINDRNSVSGSYFFGNDSLLAEDAPELLAQFQTNIHSRAQAAAGHWAWTPNSQWANELRFGFTRYDLTIIPANVNIQYNINSGITNPVLGGLPNIRVQGFTEMGGFHNFPKLIGPDNVYDFIDQVSRVVGNHAYKFGGEIRDSKVHQGTYRSGRGETRFNSLEDFLDGNPSKAQVLAGSPIRDLTQWLYAGFAQDDWRITKRVTLNLGLRYEYQGVPSEANNLLGNFDPAVGFEQVGKNISSIYKGDHTNFSPRVGVAWDVTGKGTTVVRAGGSLIYDLLPMSAFLSQQNTNNATTLGLGVIPTGAAIVVNGVQTPGVGNILATGVTIPGSQLNWNGSSVGGAPIYPANITQLVQCGDGLGNDPGPCDVFAMARDYKSPYITNWTLGIQHAFSGKLSLDVAYVGNHGSKLTGVHDINQAALGSGLSATPQATEQVTRPLYNQYPYLEFINMYSNLYRSNYNGLQSTLTARNFHGLDFVAGYTYSHALDNMSYNWNQYLPQNSLAPNADYGASDFDIRHRFTLSVTYTIPGKKTRGQLLEGWQINSIVTLQSAQPWNSFDSADNISGTGELADRWDFFGSPSDFQSQGQNSLPYCTSSAAGGCTYTTPAGPVAMSAQQSAALYGQCVAKAPSAATLAQFGCYAHGNSVLLPPAFGTFGNLGRNVFRDTGFHNWDMSISKSFKFRERFGAQFRAEMFNVINHPNFANPWGGTSGFGAGLNSDPSVAGSPYGCGCATPDVAAVNPVLGSGSARAIQLGLKLTF